MFERRVDASLCKGTPESQWRWCCCFITSAGTKLLFSSLLLQMLRACTRQVFGAITFNSAAPNWDYAIREYTVMMPGLLLAVHRVVQS